MRALLLAPALALACAHRPQVASDLPLSKVVVYRNGVGYFERAGRVSGSQVSFQVRPGHVGDFLATLAVMERGGSSVRSASFPISRSEASPTAGKGGLDTVQLHLDGKGHDLAVGYVVEQPVWRPSYRLVLGGAGPTLQAWGIVHNVSGEDWKDVSLSLVAGAPIAFRSTLATPVTPPRPVVGDQGEMITSVPRAETSLAQRPAAAAPMRKLMARPKAEASEADEAKLMASAEPEAAEAPSLEPRSLAWLASSEVRAGTTRYDLPGRVSVPTDSATMVLLASRRVEGEAVFLFAPDPGVPDSSRNPFRVARFKNGTDGILERGPIAVFEQGAFLGQGVLEPLAAGAEATVPFALERSLAVDSVRRTDRRGARLARVAAGQLFLEQDEVLRATYRLQNGGAEAARLVVKHPRAPGWRLHQPPAGTEDQVGKGAALVPAQVPGRGTAEMVVEERRAQLAPADWLSNEADEAVRAFVADGRADPRAASALSRAWTLREKIVKAAQEREKLEGERAVLEDAARQTRESLKAISRNRAGVAELRQRLSARLADLEERLARTSQRLVELNLQSSEARVAFDEAVRAIQVAEPLPQA